MSLLLKNPWLRFIFFGGMNTAFTFGIFVGLGLVMSPAIAYGIAFAVGFVAVTALSNRWVYRGSGSWSKRLSYAGWYLLIFVVGQSVIQTVDPNGIGALSIAGLMVLLVTAPLTYLGGRFIFHRQTEVLGNSPK